MKSMMKKNKELDINYIDKLNDDMMDMMVCVCCVVYVYVLCVCVCCVVYVHVCVRE